MRPILSGRSTSTWRSKRPARSRAGSDLRPVGGGEQHQPAAQVEAVQLHQELVEGLLALVVAADAGGGAGQPSASNSSMKMIAGADLRACSNRSRTRAAPTPTNISTNSEPLIEKKGAPASPATARASRVLPVPGGPPEKNALGHARASLPYSLGMP